MAGTLQLVTVSKTPVRIQTLLVQNDSFMLVNPDITNNIFVGNDPGSQIIPIPPLGSVTLNAGKHDIWVSTNGGAFTVGAFLMPNGSNWVPSPAQVAAQINALGLAKETTQVSGNTLINTVNTTLGTPPQKSDINQVNTTLGIPAQTADVGAVNFTIGSGTNPAIQVLGGAASRSIATDMLNVNKGVTTELSSLIANGVTGGTPGGVPVLRGTANIGVASAQTIAASATATLLSNAVITKPSFETIFQLNLPAAAGTVPFAVLAVNWNDSNTGLTVGFKQYVLTSGNGPANALTFYLSGPCRGNRLTVTLQNLDPGQILTYTAAINQTSHVYSVDRLLQPSYAATAPITFQNPGGNPSKGALAMVQTSIPATSIVVRLTAASNAKCKMLFDNSTTQACNILLSDPAQLYNGGTTNQNIVRFNLAANTTIEQEIQFPNGPLMATLSNTGAAAATPGLAIMVMEY